MKLKWIVWNKLKTFFFSSSTTVEGRIKNTAFETVTNVLSTNSWLDGREKGQILANGKGKKNGRKCKGGSKRMGKREMWIKEKMGSSRIVV